MDISGITNLSSFTKLNSMKKTVSSNAKNGVIGGASPFLARPFGSSGQSGGISSILPQMSEEDAALLSSALTKLQSGQALTMEELAALKEHDPAAYAKAKDNDDREAREYTKTLSRCETKEDVRMAHMGKMGEILSELGAAMQRKDVAACMRLMEKLNTLEKAYQAFTASNSFSSLAENRQELEAARSAESPVAQMEAREDAPVEKAAGRATKADAPPRADASGETEAGASRAAGTGDAPAQPARPTKAPGTARHIAVNAYSTTAGSAAAKPVAVAAPHISTPSGAAPPAADVLEKGSAQAQK